jgi:predicted DNA-binding transcriptional regulator YafY
MSQEQLLRHWKILRKIEPMHGGMTPEEIAADLKISVRTVFRDLATMQEAGLPFTSERIGGQTRYYLSRDAGAITQLGIGPSELLALYLSQGILSQLKGTIFQESIDRLLEKINAIFPDKAKDYFQELESAILIELFTKRNYQKKAKEIGAVLNTLRNRNTLKMNYFSPNRGGLERSVDPYSLWVMGDSLYLIGFCHLNNEIRTFLIDRISKAVPTKKPFKIKEGFDLKKYTGESFRVMRSGEKQTFELLFKPELVYIIGERIWHPSQKIIKHPDGSLTLTFESLGFDEIKSWVLSFGQAVKVIKPQKLRDEVRKSARQMLDQY